MTDIVDLGIRASATALQAALAKTDPVCSFLSNEESLIGYGCRHVLPPVQAEQLARHVRDFFSETREGPKVLMGALPFDRSKPAFLFQPDHLRRSPERLDPEEAGLFGALSASAACEPVRWKVTAHPPVEAYRQAVRDALDLMAQSPDDIDPLRKIVLSRSLLVEADEMIDLPCLMQHLARDRGTIAFSMPLPEQEEGCRILAGATPELLLAKSNDEIVSHPLAGSAKRHCDPAADEAIRHKLMRSAKDHREHMTVVEAILDQLAPYCRELKMPHGTRAIATASMWHLGTRIEGRLKDPSTPLMEMVGKLHPTPAVCGMPQDRAYRLIDQLEGYDRGFYAGAVGWCDAQGDGRWYVSLRCAEICGRQARVYAGAGIVEGSDPKAEADETSAKFLALLHALGIDEGGNSLRSRA